MTVPVVISKSAPKPFLGFIPPAGVPPQILANCLLEVPPYKNAKKKRAKLFH